MASHVPATVQDIARRAGLSAGTVSRILNAKNKENRPANARRAAKVRRIAAQLGYRPNAAARSMLKGRFGLIAFVTCGDPGIDWIPLSLLHGMQQAAEEAHLRVVISEFHMRQLADPTYLPPLLRESIVDGLAVYLDPRVRNRLMPALEATRQAVVFINEQRYDRAVYPNDIAATRQYTQDLIIQGRRHIAYLRYKNEKPLHYSHNDRREGYLQAVRAAGLEPMVWELDAPSCAPTERPDIVRDALARHPQTDAVICYEMIEAVTAYVAASQLHLKIPDDIAIIAFHEREVRSSAGIAIPTATIPFHEVGLRATQMLIRMIETNANSEPSIGVDYGPLKT